MKTLFISLLLLTFFFPTAPIASAADKKECLSQKRPLRGKRPIDNFIPYLEFEKFSAATCKEPRKNRVCGASTDLIQIYAEQEKIKVKKNNKVTFEKIDSLLLTIKKREAVNLPFEIDEFLIKFTYRDGIVVIYQEDYYTQFEEVRKNVEIPMGIRRWMVDIMAALRTGYSFTPKEELPCE